MSSDFKTQTKDGQRYVILKWWHGSVTSVSARVKTQINWSLLPPFFPPPKLLRMTKIISRKIKEHLGPLFGVSGKILMEDTWKKKNFLDLQEKLDLLQRTNQQGTVLRARN